MAPLTEMFFHRFCSALFAAPSSLALCCQFDVLCAAPGSSSEPLEKQHVAQVLRCFSADLSLGRHPPVDGALAHHLHQCSYHLRLFRNWLISGQDPLDYLHGQLPPLPLTYPPPAPPLLYSGLCSHCIRLVLLFVWFFCFLVLHVCLFPAFVGCSVQVEPAADLLPVHHRCPHTAQTPNSPALPCCQTFLKLSGALFPNRT